MLAKDGSYRNRLESAIKGSPDHPYHKNVRMQAHHLLSATAVKMLPEGVRRNLEYFNYDINCLDNLSFIPSTLQGACYLGVQPHRGNHNVKLADIADPEGDDSREDTYHLLVKARLIELKPLTRSKCAGESSMAELARLTLEVKAEFNKISRSVLTTIQSSPRRAPLTKLATHFQPGDACGCAGVDSVNGRKGEHGSFECPVHRNHKMNQGLGQNREEIAYDSNGRYLLEVRR